MYCAICWYLYRVLKQVDNNLVFQLAAFDFYIQVKLRHKTLLSANDIDGQKENKHKTGFPIFYILF